MSRMMDIQTDFDDSIIEYKSVSYTIRVPSSPNFPEEANTPTRYVVRLPSFPYLANQITYPITVGVLTKVTTSPASGEFRIVDSISRTRPHLIEFNSAQAGNSYTISYYAIGSIIDVRKVGFLTSTFSASVPMYVLNADDHGQNLTTSINDLPSGNKIIFLKNGEYSIGTQLDFNTNSVVEMIGESTKGVILSCTISGSSHILIRDKIIKNMTINSTLSAHSYGTVVASTALLYSTQKVENIHLTSGSTNGSGFLNCANVNNCYATAYNYGFEDCTNINNNYTTANGTGFRSCDGVVNCVSYADTVGFQANNVMYGCYAYNSVGVAFQSNQRLTECVSVTAGTYGFSGNLGIRGCSSTGSGTQNYNQTGLNYASQAVNATYAVNNANGVDTANGGFNT